MSPPAFPSLIEFEELAGEQFQHIPAEYREGIVSVTVQPGLERHPTIPDWFTLGYCQAYLPSLYAGEDAAVTSEIVLYYGSFRAIAARDESFDLEAELWETLTHELRHHLEQRAGLDDLDAEDFAMEHDQRRRQGLPFEPFYFHAGEELAPDIYRVDLDLFLEVSFSEHEWERRSGSELELEWEGEHWTVTVPEKPDGVRFEGVGPSPFNRGASEGDCWIVWTVRGWRLPK